MVHSFPDLSRATLSRAGSCVSMAGAEAAERGTSARVWLVCDNEGAVAGNSG